MREQTVHSIFAVAACHQLLDQHRLGRTLGASQPILQIPGGHVATTCKQPEVRSIRWLTYSASHEHSSVAWCSALRKEQPSPKAAAASTGTCAARRFHVPPPPTFPLVSHFEKSGPVPFSPWLSMRGGHVISCFALGVAVCLSSGGEGLFLGCARTKH